MSKTRELTQWETTYEQLPSMVSRTLDVEDTICDNAAESACEGIEAREQAEPSTERVFGVDRGHVVLRGPKLSQLRCRGQLEAENTRNM